jgi:hypothetical protein
VVSGSTAPLNTAPGPVMLGSGGGSVDDMTAPRLCHCDG